MKTYLIMAADWSIEQKAERVEVSRNGALIGLCNERIVWAYSAGSWILVREAA